MSVHVRSRPPASRCRASFPRKSLNSPAVRLPPSVRRFSCSLCGQTACIYSTSCRVTATFQHGDKERSVGFLCRVFGPFCHETHKVKWQPRASVVFYQAASSFPHFSTRSLSRVISFKHESNVSFSYPNISVCVTWSKHTSTRLPPTVRIVVLIKRLPPSVLFVQPS